MERLFSCYRAAHAKVLSDFTDFQSRDAGDPRAVTLTPGQPGQRLGLVARLGAPTPGGRAAWTFNNWNTQRLGAHLTQAHWALGPRRLCMSRACGNGGSDHRGSSGIGTSFRLETSHRPPAGQGADLILETLCLLLEKVPINIQDDSLGRQGIELRAVSHRLSHQGSGGAGSA